MISNRVIKCPISLIFKETESFGFELVSILLIKYCSRKNIIRLSLKKLHSLHERDLIAYSGENYKWYQEMVEFFCAKGFYSFFRTNRFDVFAMFFVCIPENIKPDYFYPIFLFSIGVLFLIEGIGWSCLEIMGQDSCFIFLVQLQLQ